MSEFDTGAPSGSDDVSLADGRADTFTVSVKGTGVELTRTVDQSTALSVIATVLGGATTYPIAAPFAPATPSVGMHDARGERFTGVDGLDPHTTVGEYIDECEAMQFSAKITAIGNFLELRLGQPSFTRDEVKSQFRPAGEAQPANFARDFADAIAQRWIAEDPNTKGQYFVTKTGKAAIANKFDRSSRKSTPVRRRKPAAKSGNGEPIRDADGLQELDDDE